MFGTVIKLVAIGLAFMGLWIYAGSSPEGLADMFAGLLSGAWHFIQSFMSQATQVLKKEG